MKRLFVAALLLAFGSVTAWSQSNVQIKKNIEYATHDGVSLKGDLYEPMSGSTHPAMVFIHGGGYRAGSKASYGNSWGPYLAQRGYVVFAIDYRLAKPGVPTWPQALLDCKAAIQYVRGSAAQLGLDPNRIGVGGDSAGAALAAMVGVTQDFPEFANRYPHDKYASVSTKVKVDMPIYGVYDTIAWYRYTSQQPSTNGNSLEAFIGGTPEQKAGAYFAASPLNYIREAEKSLGPFATPNRATQIPWFLAWGVEDHLVPPQAQSVAFARALREAGAQVVAIPVPKTDHFWFVSSRLTGKTGEPQCEEATPRQFTCSGATPNDYIASQLLDFLSHNL